MGITPTVGPVTKTNSRPSASLRNRVIFSILFIVAVAVVGMGYYVYLRTQETNSFLTSQLEQTARMRADETLVALSREQAAQLNSFFESMREEVTRITATTAGLLGEESTLAAGGYWNAADSLGQLPTGSWDNANDEIASVFLPVNSDLSEGLVSELNTVKHMEFTVPAVLAAQPDIIAVYFGGARGETVYFPNIDLAALVPPDFDVTARPWYEGAASPENTSRGVVWSEPYVDAALHGIVVTGAAPVYDQSGVLRGVAALDIQLTRFAELVAGIRAADTGYAFVVDSDGRLIALPPSGYSDLGLTAEELPLGGVLDPATLPGISTGFFELARKMAAGENGRLALPIAGTERYVAFAPIPEVGYSLAVIAPSAELLAEASAIQRQISTASANTLRVSLVLIGTVLLIAALGAWRVATQLTAPLGALRNTAERIIGGDLEARAEVERADEIGLLARTLNAMTSGLAEMIQSLEERVAARTALLERRAERLQAAADVGRAITSIRDLDELLSDAVHLVTQRFGYYHAGVFLLDQHREYAELRAASSTGGRRMVAHKHRLRVGQAGIVGYVAGTGTARIASDVGQDAVYFDNPDLPTTKSEMGLPLRAGQEVLGVLDVQSEEEGAFLPEDITILQVLADQLAVAVKNVQLFEENRAVLETTRRAYTEQSRDAWSELLREEGPTGILATSQGVIRLAAEGEEPTESEARSGAPEPAVLSVPIAVRGQQIGIAHLRRPVGGEWSPAERVLAQAMSDQLGGALEGARLYKESQARAARESLVAEISAKLSAESRVDNIMERTVRELRRAISDASITFRLRSTLGDADHAAGGNGDGKNSGSPNGDRSTEIEGSR